MQDYKRTAFMESDLQCSNAIQSMEKKLRAACHASDAKIDNVLKVSIHFQNIIDLCRMLFPWMLAFPFSNEIPHKGEL